MNTAVNIPLIISEGESLKVEFKKNMTNLDCEIVAFANASGGSIFLGVNDQCEIVGIECTNRLKSEIQDIARNCDPSIVIKLIHHKEFKLIEIQVDEGVDKPYRCTNGFYLRVGSSAQKLKRDEIVQLINDSEKIRFDESTNSNFNFQKDFSKHRLTNYLEICNIKSSAKKEDILLSLSVADIRRKQLVFTNACVLFFALNPQRFFPESYITCIRYQTQDRFSIADRVEIKGSPIEQIDQALQFIIRNMSVQTVVSGEIHQGLLGRYKQIYDYPIEALREAIVNAVVHRDYVYDSSHIYVHMYPEHIDIENPGGLYHGLTIDGLGKRSVRRNRLIADLLHRAGYIEKAGTGFDRMNEALRKNNNPSLNVSATNFFNIRFYKRTVTEIELELTSRQQLLYSMVKERKIIKKHEAALFMNVSDDTALRELKILEEKKLVTRSGKGKSIRYNVIAS